jgi:hypothetical protein
MTEQTDTSALEKHIRRESITNFVINFALNGGIVYGTMGSTTPLQTWGSEGIWTDLLITSFLLAGIITAIFMWMGRRQGRSGKFSQLAGAELGLAAHLPVGPALATLVFALFGMLVAAPVLLLVLGVLQIEVFTLVQYAIVKGVWTGVLAAFLVPIAFRHGLRAEEATAA